MDDKSINKKSGGETGLLAAWCITVNQFLLHFLKSNHI